MSNTVAVQIAGTDFEEMDFFLHADPVEGKKRLGKPLTARRRCAWAFCAAFASTRVTQLRTSKPPGWPGVVLEAGRRR
jgi:hypothetical protein